MFNDWKDIVKTLVDFFQTKVIINPLFAKNALIKFDHGNLDELINFPGKW